jgi:hypothetical protein
MIRRVIVLGIVMAALTWFIGWWGVLIVSLGWGLVAETHTNPARTAALAAVGAWSVLLLLTAMQGPVWTLAEMLSGIFGMPAVVLLVVTVLFPALLALSSAALVGELKRLRTT